MASMSIEEQGNCLIKLDRLEEAEQSYEKSIQEAENQGDDRGVIGGKLQLGTVYKYQKRYAEALSIPKTLSVYKVLAFTQQAILKGSRDPSLAHFVFVFYFSTDCLSLGQIRKKDNPPLCYLIRPTMKFTSSSKGRFP